jgi:hypothetical protein
MLSLSVKNIEDFVQKLGLDEFDLTNSSMDGSGDYVVTLDPDVNFSTVKKHILKNPVLNKKIVNQGVLFTEIYDTIWVEGHRVQVAILVECGIGKLGTKIKMMVKSVEAVVNGQLKQFLSFESYKSYCDLLQES